MKQRHIEKLGVAPTLLGFGCMRFPTQEGKIDEVAAKAMIDTAYKAGINYYDTAYFYHEGKSEAFMGQALADKSRDSYYLTTKLPVIYIKTLDDAKRYYEEQMTRLGTDYLDFYLLHALNGKRWQAMLEAGVVDWFMGLKATGKIRNLGFSFHGSYAEFEEILTAKDWDVCQLQLNYMDINEQAGMAGYELAASRGVPVIIMEPVKGGALAAPPAEVVAEFKAANPDASPATWALRWVASLPNVMTVLSGMSTMEQVEENLRTFGHFVPMSNEENQVVVKAAEVFHARMKNGCTACQYCMPCPAGVDIPGNFKVWNNFGIYGNVTRTKDSWGDIKPEAKADVCIDCGACETACPQNLPIRADLKRVTEELNAI